MGAGRHGGLPRPPCRAVAVGVADARRRGRRHPWRRHAGGGATVAWRGAPPAPRYRCGAYVDSDGRHFLSARPLQELRRPRLHHQIVGLVAAALRRAPGWEDVVAEAGLNDAHGVLRPDLRAKNGSLGVVTWADVSGA